MLFKGRQTNTNFILNSVKLFIPSETFIYDFDWKDQIKVISSKVSKALDLLKHTETSLSESSLRSLYFSIIEPESGDAVAQAHF